LRRDLFFEPPVDFLEQIGPDFVQQNLGAVVDPLGEDEARFTFLRFAPGEEDRFDVGLRRCWLFIQSLRIRPLLLEDRGLPRDEISETLAKTL
jgi:hypothetical protein